MPSFENPFSGLSLDRKLSKDELCRAIKFMISAEYEATQLYDQVADATNDEKAEKVIKDISSEESVHAGEFLNLLKALNPNEAKLFEQGEKESEELMNKKSIKEIKKMLKVNELIAKIDDAAGQLEIINPVLSYCLDRVSDKLEKLSATKIKLEDIAETLLGDTSIRPNFIKTMNPRNQALVVELVNNGTSNDIKQRIRGGRIDDVGLAAISAVAAGYQTITPQDLVKLGSSSKIDIRYRNPDIKKDLVVKFGNLFR